MTGFFIGGINNDFVVRLDAEAQTALRMIQPHGLHDALVKGDAIFLDIVKVAMCGHLAHIDREIGIGHLLLNRALQSASAAGGVKEEIVVWVAVQRAEKRDALYVIPMEVGEENVRVNWFARELLLQMFA